MRRVLAGLIALCLAALLGGGTTRSEPGLYTDEASGWSVDLPDGFSAAAFEEDGRVWNRLVVVSSFELGAGRLFEVLSPFPDDGVAFVLHQASGGVFWIPEPGPETAFPLDLGDFKPADAVPHGAASVPLHLSVDANGEHYDAYAWIGPDASAEHRDALAGVIASLRFPPLEPGTVTDGGFLVLEPAPRYPMGSFTRLEADVLPDENWSSTFRGAYLVHGAGGLYALAWPSGLSSGYTDCDVHFVADEHVFACEGGARWDVVGRVLTNPAPRRLRDDPLGFKIVKTSHDGKVLLYLPSTEPPGEHHRDRYWPGLSWLGPWPPAPVWIRIRDERLTRPANIRFHFRLSAVGRIDFGESMGHANGTGGLLFEDRYRPGRYRVSVVFGRRGRPVSGCTLRVTARSGRPVLVEARRLPLSRGRAAAPCRLVRG